MVDHSLGCKHQVAVDLRTNTVDRANRGKKNLPDDPARIWCSRCPRPVCVNKDFFVSDDLVWRIGGGVRYIGDKIDYLQILETPSVTLVDAMAEVTYRNNWNFSLNITNLFDKEWYASCSAPSGTQALPDGHCYAGYTRTILFSIRRRF